MAYDATNKRVYIDTSVTPNVGVSIADVKTALSESSNDLGTLCTSSRINQFSAAKPVRSSDLLVTDFAELNYGIDCDPEQMTGTIDSISSSVNNAATDPLWEEKYLKPRGYGNGEGGSNEWFRLLDFNGYRHLSVSPVSTSFDQSTGGYTLSMDANASMMQIHLMDAIENWDNLGDKDYLHYVLVATGNGTQYIIGDSLFSNGTFNGSASFTLPNILTERTYRLCVVLAPCVYEQGGSRWVLAGGSTEFPGQSAGDTPAMYLPSSFYTFTKPGPHTGIEIVNFEIWGESEADNGQIDKICWRYAIANNSGYTIRLSSNNLRVNTGDIIYDEVIGPGGQIAKSGYTVQSDGDYTESDSGSGITITSGTTSATISGETGFGGEGDDGMVVADLLLYYRTEFDNYYAEQQIGLCGDDGDWDEYHNEIDFEERIYLQ